MMKHLSVFQNWSYQSGCKILIAKCLLYFVFFFAISDSFANTKNGYIITLDKKQIPGEIQEIYYSYRGCYIKFKNDSGDEDTIYPFRIKGFSFFDDTGKEIFYESRYHENTWYYLRIMEPGKVASLLKSHHRKKYKGSISDAFRILEKEADEYWIELYDEYKLFRISAVNFRKIMRKKLYDYPEIKKKIGLKGYQYTDLHKIVKELNELYEEGVKSL